MPFAPHRLSVVFEAQSELGFTVWAYATNDPLAEVLAPDYFGRMAPQMRPGDLIVHGTNPQPASSPWQSRAEERRRTLLMVADARPGRVLTRLVQDYGRPEDEGPALGGAGAGGAAPENVTRLREARRKAR